uniref:Ras- protein Rab-4B n=1 Tax=Sphaerodactylus townsendi TaxID=933632 RepID=A0ACB8FF44_9SAUR
MGAVAAVAQAQAAHFLEAAAAADATDPGQSTLPPRVTKAKKREFHVAPTRGSLLSCLDLDPDYDHLSGFFYAPPGPTPNFLFKFLVIGSAGTGKSCLLHQFIENKFKQDSNHTIGVEFGSKVVNVGGKTVKLQIWDTAGQERFRSVTRSYYRGAAGALLVYDITSRETYNALTNWLTDARTLASPNIVIILCGNKKDLDADREVTFLEASRFAQENELMFLETSALTGENVEEAFLKCARTILNKIESGELDPERMGSGIQYGGASLRQLRQPRGTQTQTRQQCNC